MSRITDLSRQFTYDAWADARILACMQAYPLTHDLISTWSHLVSAKRMWLQRVLGESHTPLALWNIITVAETAVLLPALDKRWAAFVADLDEDDLDAPVQFVGGTGEQRSDRLIDILFHVLSHGTYHRGQIAVGLKANGIEAPLTDHIVFAREFAR